MALWQFLSIGLFVSFVTRGCATPVALLLLANWAINTVGATLSGSQFNWVAMACVDYVSALLILVICPNRWTAAIAALYAVEMIAHVAFGVSSQAIDPQIHYWDVLHYAAWAQGWALLAWAGIDGGKVVRDRFDLGRRVGTFDALRRRVGLRRSSKRD